MRLATAAMGTRFELVLPGADADRRPAAELAIEAIEDCHRRFSRFAPDSLVSHLARVPAGTIVPLDHDTFTLIADAVEVWRQSSGLFDPAAPSEGMDALELDPVARTLVVRRAGLLLDLGAIAKGHALDVAGRSLREAGVDVFFLHGGTSSALGAGAPPGESGWRVALGSGPDAPVVSLRDRALAVSRTGHASPHPTLDPRTGRPVRARRRVAVLGPSARLCDAWATAAAVLGSRPDAMPETYELRSTVNRQPSAAPRSPFPFPRSPFPVPRSPSCPPAVVS
ncbi:MAG: FAD:protein FMN transferase [Gemmatimonadales bacterium]